MDTNASKCFAVLDLHTKRNAPIDKALGATSTWMKGVWGWNGVGGYQNEMSGVEIIHHPLDTFHWNKHKHTIQKPAAPFNPAHHLSAVSLSLSSLRVSRSPISIWTNMLLRCAEQTGCSVTNGKQTKNRETTFTRSVCQNGLPRWAPVVDILHV